MIYIYIYIYTLHTYIHNIHKHIHIARIPLSYSSWMGRVPVVPGLPAQTGVEARCPALSRVGPRHSVRDIALRCATLHHLPLGRATLSRYAQSPY